MDTLGHADAPAACIVLEGSGRAGPSVVVNASRREKKEMCIPQLALHLPRSPKHGETEEVPDALPSVSEEV